MHFLGMGGLELIIILIIVLLLFGPKNLPKLSRAIGEAVKNLKEGLGMDKGGPDLGSGEEGKPDDDQNAVNASLPQAEPEEKPGTRKVRKVRRVQGEPVGGEEKVGEPDGSAVVEEGVEDVPVR